MNNEMRQAPHWARLGKTKFSLLMLAALLQAADVITTNAFLSVSSKIEANPLMRAYQDAFGQFWWIPKILFLPAILYVLARYRRIWPAVILVLLYFATVANNLYIVAVTRGF